MDKEKKPENLIKSIDEFVDMIAPGCQGAIGIMRLERSFLIDRVKELEKEKEELKLRIYKLMQEPSEEDIDKVSD